MLNPLPMNQQSPLLKFQLIPACLISCLSLKPPASLILLCLSLILPLKPLLKPLMRFCYQRIHPFLIFKRFVFISFSFFLTEPQKFSFQDLFQYYPDVVDCGNKICRRIIFYNDECEIQNFQGCEICRQTCPYIVTPGPVCLTMVCEDHFEFPYVLTTLAGEIILHFFKRGKTNDIF